MSGCPLFLSPFDAPSFWVRLSVLYVQPHTTRLSLDSCGAKLFDIVWPQAETPSTQPLSIRFIT